MFLSYHCVILISAVWETTKTGWVVTTKLGQYKGDHPQTAEQPWGNQVGFSREIRPSGAVITSIKILYFMFLNFLISRWFECITSNCMQKHQSCIKFLLLPVEFCFWVIFFLKTIRIIDVKCNFVWSLKMKCIEI